MLTGKIPEELGNLSSLNVLSLTSNALYGPIPVQLGDLTDLTTLHLGSNGLAGDIPTGLGNLTGLTSLGIEELLLDGELPITLAGLTHLESFYFGSESGLCAPKAMRIWLLRIPDAHGLSCPSFTLGSGLSPTPGARADREVLTALYNSAGGPGWFRHDNWLTLRPLDNWHGVVTDDEGRVTGLFLQDNGLKGTLPPEVGELTNLTELNLANYFTGQEDESLWGPIPPELGTLSRLTFLSLAGHGLEGLVPPELGDLMNLMELDLSRNNLSGPIPEKLGSHPNLEVLDIGGNGFNGEIPRE